MALGRHRVWARQTGYDWCLCVHAEQNAIALAARQGTATDGASLFVTLRPCFGCLKEAVQSGIHEIVYDRPFDYSADLEGAYQELLAGSGIVMRQHPYSAAHPTLSLASVGHDIGPEMPLQG